MRRLCIGFLRRSAKGGPKIFLARLQTSIERQGLAKVRPFFLPLYDVGLFASIAHSWFKKPYVLRVDGIYFDKNETLGRNEERNIPIFESIDEAIGVIYQSDFSRKVIERFRGAKKKPFCIIPNGVDTSEFSRVGENHRKKLRLKENDRVIITSARWRAHKRLRDVLNVFRRLEERNNHCYHLIILGTPDMDIPDHPNIHCLGFVSPDDLPACYRTGDVFVYLSWLDSCPNTVAEALACGLPVVCTNQGGSRELVERTEGGIVVEADEEYCFKNVDLYNPPSPDLERIVEGVERIFENYGTFSSSIDTGEIDIDNVARRYVEFIKECMKWTVLKRYEH